MGTELIKLVTEKEIFGKQLCVYGDIKKPLFLAADVAEWIGYSRTGNGSYNVSVMVKTVDDDEKMIRKITIFGQKRDVLVLTEVGLYQVLMQSRKPIAKEVKKEIKKILKKNLSFIQNHPQHERR